MAGSGAERHDCYVYALKDPRRSPALPFYIGKGVGARRFDHLRATDGSPKSRRIREIESAGFRVLVAVLADGLTEEQALKLEAELIAAFGTTETGGCLLNRVVPSGLARKGGRGRVRVPSGAQEKAQVGLRLLQDAVLELAQANPQGVTNAEVASYLGLRSDYGGGSKDYLSYSLLGLLMREGKIERVPGTRRHRATVP
ncbi:MAG: GIY-YIG nuclease family protein [Gammaproteobacteria bacterium]|nr:MAG: GIY-YIG nuclease family protein [Gammaproteobacteria bacterium]